MYKINSFLSTASTRNEIKLNARLPDTSSKMKNILKAFSMEIVMPYKNQYTSICT